MKKSCIYIDQKFHTKTGSTDFLITILERKFEVNRFFLTGFSPSDLEPLKSLDADLFVVFQYDFLSALLLSLGKRVLVVPMYDGTGEIFDEHWLLQRGALILNFSRVLNNKHRVLGLNSIYAQAFPKPVPAFQLRLRPYAPRFFLWERRPQSGLSARWLCDQIKKRHTAPELVHLHLAPDPGQTSSLGADSAHAIFDPVPVCVTSWFPTRAEMSTAMRTCNVYIAPRPAEGIGWSFLEAMAAGMLVLSRSAPTMNEYISNWHTGVLIADTIPDLDAASIRRIGMSAADYIADGFRVWERSHDELLERVCEYVSSQPTPTKYSFSDVVMLPKMFFWAHTDYAARVKFVANGSLQTTVGSRAEWSRKLTVRMSENPQLAAYVLAVHARWKER